MITNINIEMPINPVFLTYLVDLNAQREIFAESDHGGRFAAVADHPHPHPGRWSRIGNDVGSSRLE